MDVERLLTELLLHRRLPTREELEAIRDHVARAGFSDALQTCQGLGGMVWEGRVLESHQLLPTGVVHYLRHVVRKREWPDGTTFDGYIRSAAETVEHGTLALSYRANDGTSRPRIGLPALADEKVVQHVCSSYGGRDGPARPRPRRLRERRRRTDGTSQGEALAHTASGTAGRP